MSSWSSISSSAAATRRRDADGRLREGLPQDPRGRPGPQVPPDRIARRGDRRDDRLASSMSSGRSCGSARRTCRSTPTSPASRSSWSASGSEASWSVSAGTSVTGSGISSSRPRPSSATPPLPGCFRASHIYETRPVGGDRSTRLPERRGLVRNAARPRRRSSRFSQAIEREAGRVRAERWGPRTLDLDLLDLGGVVLSRAGACPAPSPDRRAGVRSGPALRDRARLAGSVDRDDGRRDARSRWTRTRSRSGPQVGLRLEEGPDHAHRRHDPALPRH